MDDRSLVFLGCRCQFFFSWPAELRRDEKLFMSLIDEVKINYSGTHRGHVFAIFLYGLSELIEKAIYKSRKGGKFSIVLVFAYTMIIFAAGVRMESEKWRVFSLTGSWLHSFKLNENFACCKNYLISCLGKTYRITGQE